MKFSLLIVENPNKLKKLSKNVTSFLREKEEDISIFHYNEFENDLFHVVLNINDEYKIGTKKLGEQHIYPYSSLNNFFFLPNSNYALIEYINEKYLSEMLSFINNHTKAKMSTSTVDNSMMISLYESLQGHVKKIEYMNSEAELFDRDFVNDEIFYDIAKNNTIDRVTFSVNNQFLSVTNEGKITVDNSDEMFLINFTKRVLISIE